MSAPALTLTAPGICHRLGLDGAPGALEVSLDNGVPTGRVVIGYLAGQPVILTFTDLQSLGAVLAALQVEGARLSHWVSAETGRAA
ncbi:MAG TPA: hypothetical protein VK586_03605 [Streptosporangiaceae bacterium]|nr:hypothetical protein [Streptosporangiaceae bacterium]